MTTTDRTDTLLTEEPTIVGADSDWPLPARVTVPGGEGAVPGVVLVHGGGPGDMDETVGPNKPFRDLALGLAERGVATLRYDKRARAHAERFAAATDPTVGSAIDDAAAAAVQLLRAHPRVAADRVLVAGLSTGAMLLGRIGEAAPDVAGLVGMAAPARSLEDLALEQLRYLS